MNRSISLFFKSIDFFKSITLLVAALIPLGLLSWVGHVDLAFSVVVGVFLCSFSDVPGSIRHMAVGILVSTLIATLTTLFINLAFISVWVMLPVLSLLIFSNSMISVYGFRASLVSFSGLLSIILAFAHPLSDTGLFIHVGLIFTGGLWYLGVSMLAHALAARRHNQLILSECMSLTAQYLEVRGEIIQNPAENDKLQQSLFQLQTRINEKHEKLREIFVAERRRRAGSSNFASRYILIFIELIDILELTISIPSSHPDLRRYSEKRTDALQTFAHIMYALSQRLYALAEVIAGDKPLQNYEDLQPLYEKARARIASFATENHLSNTHPDVIMLLNLLDYEQRQLQKTQTIERVLRDLVGQEQILYQSRDAEKFITNLDYDPSILRQHLSTGSSIFRHALRLTTTVLIGYGIGSILPIQNPYWVMLTIIVIMRPSYGLTKTRSMQRVVGTLIGGAVALIVVLLTQNPIIYGILTAISVVMAFSLIQRNYAGSAVFITLTIVFLYSLSQPDPLNVIQFRIYDTAIGALLAFLASLYLWPAWEHFTIHKVISDSIQANLNYLYAISSYYQEKGELPTSYKLARKEAFLSTGNLNAAFQRMNQEPKSKRQHYSSIYEMTVLNHTFLTAAAAMGTFIQSHSTTAKSEHFQAFIDSTAYNLKQANAALSNEELPTGHLDDLQSATTYMQQKYDSLASNGDNRPEQNELQEVSLISTQLKWLHSLSENILQIAKEMAEASQSRSKLKMDF